jgi:dTDP-4-dehydrorhamnose reductase
VTWYQFARALFELAGDLVPKPPRLTPIATADFAAPAPRPAFSVLDCGKVESDFGISRAFWRSELERALAEIRADTRRWDEGS